MTINEFDSQVGTYIVSWPEWLHPVMVAISFSGLPAVVIGVAVLAMLLAWQTAQPRLAWSLVAGVIGLGLNSILKHSLHRMRPHTPFAIAMKIKSFSFPSGHSFGAVAVYGLLAYLAYHNLSAPWNVLAGGFLVILIILIGLSRVYLGAHYPTDVLGGWAFGLITLFLIIQCIKP
jgi:undecaprenyl-diphosphatase